MSQRVTVEICSGSLESAMDAGLGGAHRIELCQNLAAGGVTPSGGTIAVACRRLCVPIHVLIRPRAGDFLPDEAEFDAMRLDIASARALGAVGVVLGILQQDGSIDRERTARLADLARPLSVTFHKAFDLVPDAMEALDTLIALGVDRVLTSGCQPTALEGVDLLKQLIERARGRITIMAGGRLTAESLGPILAATGVREIHLGSAVARVVESPSRHAPPDGSSFHRAGIDPEKVRSILDLVARIEGGRP